MGIVSEKFFKKHLGPQTLKTKKIRKFKCLQISKNYFWYKYLFILFSRDIPDQREQREKGRQIPAMREKVTIQAISYV